MSTIRQSDLTPERARQLLRYDPYSGGLFWRSNAKLAGSRVPEGYIRIMIDRHGYAIHRVIWFMAHGKWPAKYIDHINGIRDDNRLCNLREATASQNQWNKARERNTKSGLKGVYWSQHNRRWVAVCRRHYLGCFERAEDAHAAYVAKAQELYGEFARAA